MEDMEGSVVVCPRSEQFVVDILNRDSSAVEVLDPTEYKVVTVALPYDDDPESKSVRIGFIQGVWLAVPSGGNKSMSGQRIEELAESLDTEDMCGLTRGFVDDLEMGNFLGDRTGIRPRLDWCDIPWNGWFRLSWKVP